jgi:hypothetical protein
MYEPIPQPYKYCVEHMRPSIGPNRCQICFPGQTSVEPPPPVRPAGAQEAGAVSQVPAAETPTPPLTDPLAQRVVQAAQDYARAIEAVSILAEQVKNTKELLAAFETKLKETKAMADAAQDELRSATEPSTVKK